MKNPEYSITQRWASRLLLPALCLATSLAHADVEPNDGCLSADRVELSSMPTTLNGTLEAPGAGRGDIDFYLISATPETPVQITLEGDSEHTDALGDPMLAYLGLGCELLASNDDYFSLMSRLPLYVPASGTFVIAVTGSGDMTLTGDHRQSGGYRLSFSTYSRSVGSISGLYLDAITGRYTPQGSVELLRCTDGDDPESCTAPVASQGANGGAYSFNVDWDGMPLEPGYYRVEARFREESTWSDIFSVAENQHYRVPTLYYEEPLGIGTIEGRLVDAMTGVGLSGEEYPFASVRLRQFPCIEFCYSVDVAPDRAGYFRFDETITPDLRPGEYSITASASDYETRQLPTIASGVEGETLSIGDIALDPKPVRISVTSPCDSDSIDGGICRYRVSLDNRSPEQIRGSIWSIASGYLPGGTLSSTEFQAGDPVPISLRAGESRAFYFEFPVPSTLRGDSTICSTTYFGEGYGNQPYFNPSVNASSCLTKTGEAEYSILSKKESQALIEAR
ncbi:hypothetical protein ThidrDRAFT_1510 [Thiorhodococcus drewsii AZ1]|uniref:Carboxypeptidase regulatory-like domain-containing protein n=1 Tax=Thiorhodococcus drewsii AZ1 TaxID=765913 RepID=G2DZP7_9GAMM|nr:carboxypeptidase-like regulatory domain-containing protein [Thiorhodococcus drewsii]EGV32274.1 hypothetical protein ThidrDRAFT_1510 [Thiorhodococcus drewsii AZ1]